MSDPLVVVYPLHACEVCRAVVSTGDMLKHHAWHQKEIETQRSIMRVFETLREMFKTLGGVAQ